MRSFFQVTVCVLFALSTIAGCLMDVENADENESLGVVTQALDSAHTRVIQECSQAMSGSWWTYNETNWPTGTTYGNYPYISNDLGAWGKLLDNTYNGSVRGWWTSCRRTNSPPTNNDYGPGYVCLQTYGDLDTASLYDCQGTCTSGIKHRGGQCKPFMNLVAYRSGKYQGPPPNYAWKAFPTDTCVTYTTASCNTSNKVLRPSNDTDMPLATYTNIVEGDYLRRPGGHAAIVVRKVSSTNVIVLDSNWSDGDGKEVISSHSMAFGSGDSNSNLGAYRVLKCAYTGGC